MSLNVPSRFFLDFSPAKKSNQNQRQKCCCWHRYVESTLLMTLWWWHVKVLVPKSLCRLLFRHSGDWFNVNFFEPTLEIAHRHLKVVINIDVDQSTPYEVDFHISSLGKIFLRIEFFTQETVGLDEKIFARKFLRLGLAENFGKSHPRHLFR